MSNFDIAGEYYDPSKVSAKDYDNIKDLNKDDILEINNSDNFYELNQAQANLNKTIQSNLRPKSSTYNRTYINNNVEYGIYSQKKKNTTDPNDLIPSQRTCGENEKEFVKYGLENLPKVISTLTNENNNVFSLITDKQTFNILIDDSSIPHILGLLHIDSIDKNETRIYTEIKDQLDIEKNKYSDDDWKKHKKTIYLKTFKNIIKKYKDKILHTYSNIDDYPKDLLGKISFKVSNIQYIIEKLQINDVNTVEIFNSTKNKESYLLTIPITDKNSYCCLVIIKNNDNFTYSLKSGGILTKKEYDKITSKTTTTFADNWKKTNLTAENYVYKTNTTVISTISDLEEKRNKTNKSFYGINLQNSNGKRMSLANSINKQLIAKYFNEIINRNNCKVIEEIYKLLINSSPDEIKEKLPFLLIKLYQNFISDKDNKNIIVEDYYKTLLILANEFNYDIEVNNLLNACYTNNIEEINRLINDEKIKLSDCYASISIIKENKNFYINGIVEIKSELLELNDSLNKDQNLFSTQIENINKKLEEIYNKIQSINIQNMDDAKKYILLLNDFYYIYELIQSTIINLYSYCMTDNTKINDICNLSNLYPNIFNILTEIGYNKPFSKGKKYSGKGNYNNYIDCLINNLQNQLRQNMKCKYKLLLDLEIITLVKSIIPIIPNKDNKSKLDLQNVEKKLKLLLIKRNKLKKLKKLKKLEIKKKFSKRLKMV